MDERNVAELETLVIPGMAQKCRSLYRFRKERFAIRSRKRRACRRHSRATGTLRATERNRNRLFPFTCEIGSFSFGLKPFVEHNRINLESSTKFQLCRPQRHRIYLFEVLFQSSQLLWIQQGFERLASWCGRHVQMTHRLAKVI